MPEPLTLDYLQQCEFRARRFSGAYTGTSGSLAADVLRLLAEVRRFKVEAAYQYERKDYAAAGGSFGGSSRGSSS
jgi:hypothetical protein